MKKPDIDDLLVLSEEQAVLKHFDYINYAWFRLSLVAFFVFGVFAMLVEVLSLDTWNEPDFGLVSPAVLIVGCAFLFFSRKRRWVQGNFHQVCSSYLFVMMSALFLFRSSFLNYNAWVLSLWIVPLMFSFRNGTIILLYATGLFMGWFDSFFYKSFETEHIVSAVTIGIFQGGGCIFSMMLARSRRDRFLEVWETEADRHRERLRMKQELEQARDIQLSLLPHGNPDFERLDISCSSTPATEVGGDYFEYFPLSDTRMAIVVGDVSGHGVSSGLVLSGVRSCLYLLRDDLPEPGELLGKLNRMLKKTTAPQMFMTFVMVIFDLENREMILANAGHPPILHYKAAQNTVVEHKHPALPLGGVMKATYREVKVPFEPDDIFVIYTDGLTEAHAGDPAIDYGEGRLKGKIKDLAMVTDDAETLRIGLLDDVSAFMDGTEQDDDITLVVARIL